jgi:hypothetical protein
VSACEEKGVKAYAVTASIDGFDRGRSAAVAGEQFHTDGGIDQIAFECRRGDRHGFVAAGHFWAVSLAVTNARWDVNSLELADGKWLRRMKRAQRSETITVPDVKAAVRGFV